MQQDDDRAVARIEVMLANTIRLARVIDNELGGGGHVLSRSLLSLMSLMVWGGTVFDCSNLDRSCCLREQSWRLPGSPS
jgi:hypothetical protein